MNIRCLLRHQEHATTIAARRKPARMYIGQGNVTCPNADMSVDM
jgi:hypothetical protein